MKYTDEDIHKFMEIYRAEFGKEISPQDALEMATRLIDLYLIIYRPLPGANNNDATRPSEDRRGPDASFQDAG